MFIMSSNFRILRCYRHLISKIIFLTKRLYYKFNPIDMFRLVVEHLKTKIIIFLNLVF